MANVSKWMAEARRLEAAGDLSAAIDQYRKALALQEQTTGAADLSLYNRIGDLYLRCEDVARAIASYGKAADHYEDQQLYSNAIALCKKMLRNAPDHAPAHRRAGRLSALSGLEADASASYETFARRRFDHGESKEALEALREFVEVSDSDRSRLLLAEYLERSGYQKQALDTLYDLWEARTQDSGNAAEIRELMLKIDPSADPKVGSRRSDPPLADTQVDALAGSDDADAEAASVPDPATTAGGEQTEMASLTGELQRVLDGLDGDERMRRALPIIEQLIEFEPDKIELLQKKLTYALALGNDETAIEAYMALGSALERRLNSFSLRFLTTSSSTGSVASAIHVESRTAGGREDA